MDVAKWTAILNRFNLYIPNTRPKIVKRLTLSLTISWTSTRNCIHLLSLARDNSIQRRHSILHKRLFYDPAGLLYRIFYFIHRPRILTSFSSQEQTLCYNG